MTPVTHPDVLDRWRAQPCTNPAIENLEHARFVLTYHDGHGCDQFLAALGRESVVLR
ncbi:hypothetical protein IU459_21695 [Nocardia amamiensis]|uniref:Uncharacterized protein n=1 Tax=Nocardia amamiensis TaxID=404578 RepID=A0ABS0CWF8_9NOCA|nr:hypothetical protein [Nocardia amamiensis]MBF6300137.1 hypothetical protein [Nocardia amamiensis]